MVLIQSNGFFQHITINYGKNNTEALKAWINTNKKICTAKQQLTFLIRCRRHDILPTHIKNINLHVYFYSKSANQALVKLSTGLHHKILNLEIKDLNFRLKRLQNDVKLIENKLKNNLPRDLLNGFYEMNVNTLTIFMNNKRNAEIKKFNFLVKKENVCFDPFKDIDNSKWIINISDTVIPKKIIDFLSLGDRFAPPIDQCEKNDRCRVVVETIKSTEICINDKKIPSDLMDSTRNSTANHLKSFLSKQKHLDVIDRYMLNSLTIGFQHGGGAYLIWPN